METNNNMRFINYSNLHPRDFDLRFPYTDKIAKKEKSLPKVKVTCNKKIKNHHITMGTIHLEEDRTNKENQQILHSTLPKKISKDSHRKNAEEKPTGVNKQKKEKRNAPVKNHQQCPECGLSYEKNIIEVHLSQCSIIRENEIILPKIQHPKMTTHRVQYKQAAKDRNELQGKQPWVSNFLIGHTKNVRICSISSKLKQKTKNTNYNPNVPEGPAHQNQATKKKNNCSSNPQYCRKKGTGNESNMTGKNEYETDRCHNRKDISSENGIYRATKSSFRRTKINDEYSWKRQLYEIYELSWKQFEKMVLTSCNNAHEMTLSPQKVCMSKSYTLRSYHGSKITSQMPIAFSDIPFPPIEQLDGLELIGIFSSNEQKSPKNDSRTTLDDYNTIKVRRLLRNAMMRWHPDKFQQCYGNCIRQDELQMTMKKVKECFQAINTLKSVITEI